MNKEELIRFFKNDRFVDHIGVEIVDIGEGKAVCAVDIKEHHLNANNVVQGGVLYTIGDFTFAVAANQDEIGFVTLNAIINYIRPCICKRLFACAEPVHVGRHTCVYNVEMKDEAGKVFAVMTVNGYKK